MVSFGGFGSFFLSFSYLSVYCEFVLILKKEAILHITSPANCFALWWFCKEGVIGEEVVPPKRSGV